MFEDNLRYCDVCGEDIVGSAADYYCNGGCMAIMCAACHARLGGLCDDCRAIKMNEAAKNGGEDGER